MGRERTLTRRLRRRVREQIGLPARFVKGVRRLWRIIKPLGGMAILCLGTALAAGWFTLSDHGWMLALLFLALASVGPVEEGCRSQFYGREAAELSFFPLSDEEIFRRVWNRWHFGRVLSLAIFTVWFAVITIGCSRELEVPIPWLAIPVAATAQWILVTSLIAARTACLPQVRIDYRLSLGLLATLPLLLFGARWLAAPLAPSIEWLLLLLPTGWVAGALLAWLSPTDVPWFIYAACFAAVVAPLPWFYRIMRRDYAIRELDFWGSQPMFAVAMSVPEDAIAPPCEADASRQVRRASEVTTNGKTPASQLQEWWRHSTRQALDIDAHWRRKGWMERIAGRYLTPRERALAALFLADPRDILYEQHALQRRSWGQQWLRAGKWLAILTAIAIVSPLGESWKWLAFLPVFIVTTFATPLFGGLWSGLDYSGRSFSVANLPIPYREILRVVVRCNRTRLLFWIPLVAAGCAVAGWKTDVGAWTGLQWGLRGIYLAIVLQPLPFLLRMNEGTNDRSRFLTGLFTVTTALVLIGLLIASGAALFQSEWQMSVAGALGLAIATQLLVILDTWRHEVGRLDLVGKPNIPEYWN